MNYILDPNAPCAERGDQQEGASRWEDTELSALAREAKRVPDGEQTAAFLVAALREDTGGMRTALRGGANIGALTDIVEKAVQRKEGEALPIHPAALPLFEFSVSATRMASNPNAFAGAASRIPNLETGDWINLVHNRRHAQEYRNESTHPLIMAHLELQRPVENRDTPELLEEEEAIALARYLPKTDREDWRKEAESLLRDLVRRTEADLAGGKKRAQRARDKWESQYPQEQRELRRKKENLIAGCDNLGITSKSAQAVALLGISLTEGPRKKNRPEQPTTETSSDKDRSSHVNPEDSSTSSDIDSIAIETAHYDMAMRSQWPLWREIKKLTIIPLFLTPKWQTEDYEVGLRFATPEFNGRGVDLALQGSRNIPGKLLESMQKTQSLIGRAIRFLEDPSSEGMQEARLKQGLLGLKQQTGRSLSIMRQYRVSMDHGTGEDSKYYCLPYISLSLRLIDYICSRGIHEYVRTMEDLYSSIERIEEIDKKICSGSFSRGDAIEQRSLLYGLESQVSAVQGAQKRGAKNFWAARVILGDKPRETVADIAAETLGSKFGSLVTACQGAYQSIVAVDPAGSTPLSGNEARDGLKSVIAGTCEQFCNDPKDADLYFAALAEQLERTVHLLRRDTRNKTVGGVNNNTWLPVPKEFEGMPGEVLNDAQVISVRDTISEPLRRQRDLSRYLFLQESKEGSSFYRDVNTLYAPEDKDGRNPMINVARMLGFGLGIVTYPAVFVSLSVWMAARKMNRGILRPRPLAKRRLWVLDPMDPRHPLRGLWRRFKILPLVFDAQDPRQNIGSMSDAPTNAKRAWQHVLGWFAGSWLGATLLSRVQIGKVLGPNMWWPGWENKDAKMEALAKEAQGSKFRRHAKKVARTAVNTAWYAGVTGGLASTTLAGTIWLGVYTAELAGAPFESYRQHIGQHISHTWATCAGGTPYTQGIAKAFGANGDRISKNCSTMDLFAFPLPWYEHGQGWSAFNIGGETAAQLNKFAAELREKLPDGLFGAKEEKRDLTIDWTPTPGWVDPCVGTEGMARARCIIGGGTKPKEDTAGEGGALNPDVPETKVESTAPDPCSVFAGSIRQSRCILAPQEKRDDMIAAWERQNKGPAAASGAPTDPNPVTEAPLVDGMR